jgi:hypothetical protein
MLNMVGGLKDIADLFEDTFSLIRIFTAHGRDDAGFQVLVKEKGRGFAKRGLNGLDLADDIDTIGAFFQHALDAAQVSFSDFQTVYGFGMVFNRLFSFPVMHPTPLGGVSGVILS